MKYSRLIFLFFLLTGCVSQTEHKNAIAKLDAKIDSLSTVISKKDGTISVLRDSISILSYPADQRLNAIISLVKEDKFDDARNEIAQLKKIFPNSDEAQQCQAQLDIIEKKEEAIKAEEERLKALGFKAFKDISSVVIDDRTCTFSSFTFGRTFTFDSCSDVGEYSYRTADKNNTYILASMSMSTKEDYASTPSIYACKIVDGKLERIGYFSDEYASWTSYGAKLGTYSDDSHDFSKVNSVRYKIASEISNEEAKMPIVIVIPKKDKDYSDGMNVEQASENLHVIKIINRNKM